MAPLGKMSLADSMWSCFVTCAKNLESCPTGSQRSKGSGHSASVHREQERAFRHRSRYDGWALQSIQTEGREI